MRKPIDNKKCNECKKIYSIANFSKKWSKKNKAYYSSSKCKNCLAKIQARRRLTSGHKKYAKNYFNLGYYGWTRKVDQNLFTTYSHGLNLDNEWENKFDMFVRILKNMDRTKAQLIDNKARSNKNLKSILKLFNKIKRKRNNENILDELIMKNCMSEYAQSVDVANLNIWERKIRGLNVSTNRRYEKR